jgi:anthranilate synthase component 2
VVREDDLPRALRITARDTQGQIMAISHETYDVRAVQFHPESILTEHGKQMIRNWIEG